MLEYLGEESGDVVFESVKHDSGHLVSCMSVMGTDIVGVGCVIIPEQFLAIRTTVVLKAIVEPARIRAFLDSEEIDTRVPVAASTASSRSMATSPSAISPVV